MTGSTLVRRLTTIVDIDVVGFTAMSARDEEHALDILARRMDVAQGLVKHHRGRVFKLTGDGLLAEFASPVEAVRAALEIQEAMRSANGPAGPNDQLVLRIGINLGDVVESGDDLMGDAVNVAARLESIALPGGVCVSAAVYEQIEGKLTLGAEDMGAQHVKNIPRPIHVYRLTMQGAAPSAVRPPASERSRRLFVILGAAAIVAAFALSGAWLLHEWGPRGTLTTRAPAPPPVFASTATPPSAPVAAPAPPSMPAPGSPTPTPTSVPGRGYSAAEVPFVPDRQHHRLEHYAQADDAKAMAINVRGILGVATRRVDDATARRIALEECNALVLREVPIVRDFDRCMLYAVGNEVVWSFRPPPMPPTPYVPSVRPSPPVMVEAGTVPLLGEAGRRNVAEHYVKSERKRAMVLGYGRFEWWSPSDSEADAIRRNLQTCGHITGRPCVVYAIDQQVVVRVPQLHRIINIFTPQDLTNLDAAQQAAVERYLVADDWRAIAVARNGHLGIVTGRADEHAAESDAASECNKAGGTGCTVLAVGPFVVAPK